MLGAFHIGSLQVHCVRNVGACMFQYPVTVLIKIPCGSYSPFEFSDEVSKTLNWSQHSHNNTPFTSIYTGRSKFISCPPP